MEQVENENAFLKKQLYGPKSERPTGEVQFVMGELFAQAEEEQSSESDPEAEDDEEPELEDPDSAINPETGEPYPILRYEETRKLAEGPAKLLVLVMKRPVYIMAKRSRVSRCLSFRRLIWEYSVPF